MKIDTIEPETTTSSCTFFKEKDIRRIKVSAKDSNCTNKEKSVSIEDLDESKTSQLK